jgi:hypothetical protein
MPSGAGGGPASTNNGGAGASTSTGGGPVAAGDAGATTPLVDAGGLVDAGAPALDAGVPFEPEPDGIIVLAVQGFRSGN